MVWRLWLVNSRIHALWWRPFDPRKHLSYKCLPKLRFSSSLSISRFKINNFLPPPFSFSKCLLPILKSQALSWGYNPEPQIGGGEEVQQAGEMTQSHETCWFLPLEACFCWGSCTNQSMRSEIPISRKIFFKINKARLFKLTCSGYLQSKLTSPRLLRLVDFETGMLNDEECVLRVLRLNSKSSLWWLNMTMSVDSQLEVVILLFYLFCPKIHHYSPLFIDFDLFLW